MQKMRPFQKFYFIIFMQTEHPGKKNGHPEGLRCPDGRGTRRISRHCHFDFRYSS